MKIFFLCLLFFIQLFSVEADYLYKEAIGKKQFTSTWHVRHVGKNISVKGSQLSSKMEVLYTSSFILKRYNFEDNSKDLKFFIYQKNNTLFIKAEKQGKKIVKKYRLKNPWIQQFSFGFIPFVQSKKKTLKFSLISPKDFKMYGMMARKKQKEIININGKSYKTQIVEVSLSGIKRLFWKAKLWFLENGDLLKYASNSGPKTPEIFSFLEDKKIVK